MFPFLDIFRDGRDFLRVILNRTIALKKFRFFRWGYPGEYLWGHDESLRTRWRVGHRMGPGPKVLVDKLVQGGQVRKTYPSKFIQAIIYPSFFVTSFSKCSADSQPVSQFCAYPIIRITFSRGVDQFWLEDDLVAIFPAILHTPGFELGASRQNDICKSCTRRQKLSCTTRNSTLVSSLRISAVRLMSACWLIRQLVATP